MPSRRPIPNPDGAFLFHNDNHNAVQFILTAPPQPILPYNFTDVNTNFTIEWGYPTQVSLVLFGGIMCRSKPTIMLIFLVMPYMYV